MCGTLLAARLDKPDVAALRRRRGILLDHALVFNKEAASEPGIGYASVVERAGCSVEGVLNDVDQQDLIRLDRIELVPHHYLRVSMLVEATAANLVWAEVYSAATCRVRSGLRPRRDYIERLLGGADILSAHYVDQLRDLPVAAGDGRSY
jgi:gamma-glutamylcyclotransferase (GGCT)/AIG2-like uncharacterized protein YtfP